MGAINFVNSYSSKSLLTRLGVYKLIVKTVDHFNFKMKSLSFDNGSFFMYILRSCTYVWLILLIIILLSDVYVINLSQIVLVFYLSHGVYIIFFFFFHNSVHDFLMSYRLSLFAVSHAVYYVQYYSKYSVRNIIRFIFFFFYRSVKTSHPPSVWRSINSIVYIWSVPITINYYCHSKHNILIFFF